MGRLTQRYPREMWKAIGRTAKIDFWGREGKESVNIV